MSFRVRVTSTARKELVRLPANKRYQLLKGLTQLEEDPAADGDTTKGIVQDPKGMLRRLRVGHYRIFFEVEVMKCTR